MTLSFILLYAPFYFYALFIFLAFYISCNFHLCSFGHLFSCHFYFAHLSFFFFLFLRYLITNLNPKKLLTAFGLFGYYPWHDGAVDFFGLRIRNLGLSWRPCDLIWLFCLEHLRFTSRHWVACLFLCAGFCDCVLDL